VSPILVRPVREQLEHDRIIRLLQAKCRRKYEVGINPGSQQNTPVGTGPTATYPDLVLLSQERGRRLQGVVEVETGESVNHLEALAQWAHYARLRAPFHLYVPAGMVDVARRLAEENQIHVNEIWSYHAIGDEIRFTLVHRSRETPAAVARARAAAARPAAGRPAAAAPRRKPAPRAAKRPARAQKAAKPARKSARSSKRK
jgi:nucleoid-associated protein YgaU